MKIVNAITGSLLLAVAPLAVGAEDMSYSYLEAGWVNTDFDDFDESADGPGVRGSIGFAENFFAFAEYVTQEVEFLGVDIDVDQIAVGLGGHLDITEKVDLVGRVGYVEAESGNAEVDGYLVSAGVRAQVAENFELEGHVVHTDLGSDGGDDTGLAVAGRYFFTESFAVGAEYQMGDSADTWILGVRFAF